MFDFIKYLCVSRDKTSDRENDFLKSQVLSQYVCPYCGDSFGFHIRYQIHIDSCSRSGATLPDPSYSRGPTSAKTQESLRKSTSISKSSPLDPKKLGQIEKIVQNLKGQPTQKRRSGECHFITKYVKSPSNFSYHISNEWLQDLYGYLKGKKYQPPGPINNNKIESSMTQGYMDSKASSVNEIIWKFLHLMYGGGPEVVTKGEPSSVFANAIEIISVKNPGLEHSTFDDLQGETDLAPNASLYKKTPSYMLDNTSNGVTGVRGLKNEGFYCYMNACIQALLGVRALVNSIKTGQYKSSLKTSNPKYWKAMADLVTLMESGSQWSSVTPQDLRKLATARFRPRDQHDAHEFICFLLSNMQDEMNFPRSKETIAFQDPESAWAHYCKYNISIVDQIFAGQLLSIIVCEKCSYVSKVYDPFLELSLPIMPQKTRSVEDCLRLFTTKELITTGYKCEKCKNKGGAYKQILPLRLPNILIVHLNRFRMRPSKSKISGHIEFPIDGWRIQAEGNNQDRTYSLIGVVVHMGGMDSGHYIAFSKREGQWYQCDDERVKAVDLNSVTRNEAYVLIYESI